MMKGIYKITNKKNDKCYIGLATQSIEQRWYQHRSCAFNPNSARYNVHLSQAIRKYGLDNFIFEVVEEIEGSPELFTSKEVEWITYYDSYRNGYNMTPGGDFGVSQPGEANGRALLNLSEVIDIRTAYDMKIPFRVVFEKYQNKISKRGLQKVWHGHTWSGVMDFVYTEENKAFHKNQSKSLSRNEVHNSKLTDNEVEELLQARLLGASPSKYWKEHFEDKISFSGFENIWYQKSK